MNDPFGDGPADKTHPDADAGDSPSRTRRQQILLVVDLAMVALILLNLVWIIFDSAYAVPEIRSGLRWLLGDGFVNVYGDAVHDHFFRYDLIFVAIFATELIARWIASVRRDEYGHWLAYPILHWYDVLGCIPIAGFRLLRLLRVFAVGMRLQKLGVIHVETWWITRKLVVLYDIVMEEVSDRVVIRILGGVQQELRAGDDLERRIIEQVVRPRQAQLVERFTKNLSNTAGTAYSAHQREIEQYVKTLVADAVRANREIRVIDRLPMVGGVATKLLEHAITDIVNGVIERGVQRLNSQEFQRLFDSVAATAIDAALGGDLDPNGEISQAVIDVLDVIKAEVAKRRWLEQLSGNTDAKEAAVAPTPDARTL